MQPIPVILDTDMATDCDDAGALAMLLNLERQNQAEVLGVVVNNRGGTSVGAVAAITAFYGRPDIPMGAYQGDVVGVEDTELARSLAEDTAAFGHRVRDRREVPSAHLVYRRLLAQRERADVVIISIGHLNNLVELLDSPGDDHSPENGIDLVRRSVSHAVVMGGNYPSGKEHNFYARGSAASTVRFMEVWPTPTPILFSGYELGVRVLTGPGLAQFGDEHPVARAYRHHPTRPLQNGRPSWDQTAVLAAIAGPEVHWDLSTPGWNRIAPDGANQWEPDPTSPHTYLLERDPPEIVAAAIERLMLG